MGEVVKPDPIAKEFVSRRGKSTLFGRLKDVADETKPVTEEPVTVGGIKVVTSEAIPEETMVVSSELYGTGGPGGSDTSARARVIGGAGGFAPTHMMDAVGYTVAGTKDETMTLKKLDSTMRTVGLSMEEAADVMKAFGGLNADYLIFDELTPEDEPKAGSDKPLEHELRGTW